MVAPAWGNNDELWQPRSLLADSRGSRRNARQQPAKDILQNGSASQFESAAAEHGGQSVHPLVPHHGPRAPSGLRAGRLTQTLGHTLGSTITQCQSLKDPDP